MNAQIILRHLPKVSLNKWYSSTHWTKRKQLKDNYKWIIKSQFKTVFKRNLKYDVDYVFYYKKNPLDALNTAAMAKLIEDVIFEQDKHDIVLKVSLSSKKGKSDYVVITVNEVED